MEKNQNSQEKKQNVKLSKFDKIIIAIVAILAIIVFISSIATNECSGVVVNPEETKYGLLLLGNFFFLIYFITNTISEDIRKEKEKEKEKGKEEEEDEANPDPEKEKKEKRVIFTIVIGVFISIILVNLFMNQIVDITFEFEVATLLPALKTAGWISIICIIFFISYKFVGYLQRRYDLSE